MRIPLQNFLKIALVTTLCLFWVQVHAGSQYTASPLVIDTKVEARDIITKEIIVTNTGAQPVTLYPTVNNISLEEGGTIEEFLPPVSSDRTQSLASWIEINRLGIDLQQGESRKIPLTLRINPSPVAGTYHSFIGFGTGRNRDEAEAQVKAGQAPGTIITVTIDEKKNEFLKLSKFIVSRFVTKVANQAAVYTFVNPGDETLVPKGEIIIYDGKGKEVSTITVNDQNISLKPGEEYSFIADVPVGGLFGKYKAFLSVEYGTTQRGSVQDTSFFYVIPVKIILIILGIVLLVVIFVAWHIHKKYLDDEIDDSDRLTMHIRDTESEAKEHDVIMKQK